MQEKFYLKDSIGINTSNFALNLNLASLKTELDKLDIDKFASVPVDLTVYDNLVAKVNNVDTTGVV